MTEGSRCVRWIKVLLPLVILGGGMGDACGGVVGAGGLLWLVYEVWVWLRTIWYGYRGIRARLMKTKKNSPPDGISRGGHLCCLSTTISPTFGSTFMWRETTWLTTK